MNKKIFIFLAIITIGAVVVCFKVFRQESAPVPYPGNINNFEQCVLAGYPVLESYPRQCKTPEGKTFTEDIGNELEKIDLIRLSNPRPNQIIQSPLLIEGEARGFWFFEASFPVKILDEKGNLIFQSFVQAKEDWMTEEFVPFETEISFDNPGTGKGTLILEKDNPSGLPEHADELIVPIRFGPRQETITLKAYFNNSRLDPEFSCNKVAPVERQVAKTLAVGRAALEELLQGPTEEEKSEGYFTSINSGVEIQSLTIENGIAKVDFNEQLEFQVGGSCKVSAIRAQIRETLLQFETVDSVIISINGRTEDILQP